MMKISISRLGLFCGILYLGIAGLAGAIPGRLSISGRLLDSSGNPVHYYKTETGPFGPHQIETSANLKSQLYFYDTATASTAFSNQLTTATAFGGYFSITFTAPAEMLIKDSVWYAVAIDADQNGLTSADTFPDRFEIGSVPFALSAKPERLFSTNNGLLGQVTNPGHDVNYMDVIPFTTPEGGVTFNRMNTYLNSGQPGNAFSFGLYDESGKRVAYSGMITISGSAGLSHAFLEVKLATPVTLGAAKTYYVGFARNDMFSLSFPAGNLPAAPVMGTIPLTNSKGDVAASFDPTKINPTLYVISSPITFRMVESGSSGKIQWNKPTGGGPEYRWIQSGQNR